MGTMTDILKRIDKKIEIAVSIDSKPFLEVSVEKKEITIEVRDTLAAIEYGMKKILDKKAGEKSATSKILKMIKDKGYRIRIKYGVFEFNL